MVRAIAITARPPAARASAAATIARVLNVGAAEARRMLTTETSLWEHDVTWAISAPSAFERQVTTADPVFLYQNDGTRPHTIRPVRRRWLRFAADGGVVFTKQVRHPGTKARRYTTAIAPRVSQVLAREAAVALRGR